MALQMYFEKESGLILEDSYWYLNAISVDDRKGSTCVVAHFKGWVNKEAFDAGKPCEQGMEKSLSFNSEISKTFFSIQNLSTSNPYAVAYSLAKEDEFFENAIDVDLIRQKP